jgi:hypothetical protein
MKQRINQRLAYAKTGDLQPDSLIAFLCKSHTVVWQSKK